MVLGPGAGGDPTATAVLGDVIDAARETLAGAQVAPRIRFSPGASVPFEDVSTRWYVRLHVDDRPGVLAKIAAREAKEQLERELEEKARLEAEAEAEAEAGRCMSCGMCFECDNCVIYCPQDAVFRVKKDKQTLGRYVDTDYTKCIGCHICSDVCPTGYIDMALGVA